MRPACGSSTIRATVGYGAALRTGFAAASKPWIFYTDGDAQYDPQELRLLLVDACLAWAGGRCRQRLQNQPQRPLVPARHRAVYHHFVKAMFGFKLRDVDCDFRLIRRAVFDTDPTAFRQRHDLPGTREETPGRRVPFCRGAGASFPPGVRALAVFQLPPALAHGAATRRNCGGTGVAAAPGPRGVARSRAWG